MFTQKFFDYDMQEHQRGYLFSFFGIGEDLKVQYSHRDAEARLYLYPRNFRT